MACPGRTPWRRTRHGPGSCL